MALTSPNSFSNLAQLIAVEVSNCEFFSFLACSSRSNSSASLAVLMSVSTSSAAQSKWSALYPVETRSENRRRNLTISSTPGAAVIAYGPFEAIRTLSRIESGGDLSHQNDRGRIIHSQAS